jgi:uncharacterized phage infection (PIP) family protein YhgE
MHKVDLAAEDLVKKITTELDPVLEQVKERFTTLHEQLRETERELDEDIAALRQRVADFIRAAQEEEGRLARGGEDAMKALDQTAAAVRTAQQAIDSEVNDTVAALADLAQLATQLEPQVENLVAGRAESPAHELAGAADQASESIDEALEHAGRAVQESLTAPLVALQEKVPDGGGKAEEQLEDCVEQLEGAYVEWATKLAEVADTVQNDGFHELTSNAQAVIEHALGECAKAEEEQLGRVLEGVERLTDVLSDVEKATEASAEHGIEDGAQKPLDRVLDDAKDAAQDAGKALDKVHRWLDKKGYA